MDFRNQFAYGSKNPANQLVLPVYVNGSYEFQVTGTHVEAGITVADITLSHTAQGAVFYLNTSGNHYSGLSWIDGERVDVNRSRTPAFPLRVGAAYLLKLRVVREDEQLNITATVDEKPYFQWSGPRSSLSLNNVPSYAPLSIAAWNSAFRVQSLRFKLIDGDAWE